MPSPSPLYSLSEASWRSQGLFNDHYLSERLPTQDGWPDAAESDHAFEQARALLIRRLKGLRIGNEEDCEERFVTPLLGILGFGLTHRRRIPDVPEAQYPGLPPVPLVGGGGGGFRGGEPRANHRVSFSVRIIRGLLASAPPPALPCSPAPQR